MGLKGLWAAGALGLSLSACVSQSEGFRQYRQMSPEARAEAGKRADVSPAGISTIQFKESGESARHRVLAGFINRAWSEQCDVVSANLSGYSPAGSSQWRVKCRNTPRLYDYSIAIPEKASSPARVLPCHAPRPRVIECSILGRPTSAGE
jgi:hypothetical protein